MDDRKKNLIKLYTNSPASFWWDAGLFVYSRIAKNIYEFLHAHFRKIPSSFLHGIFTIKFPVLSLSFFNICRILLGTSLSPLFSFQNLDNFIPNAGGAIQHQLAIRGLAGAGTGRQRWDISIFTGLYFDKNTHLFPIEAGFNHLDNSDRGVGACGSCF